MASAPGKLQKPTQRIITTSLREKIQEGTFRNYCFDIPAYARQHWGPKLWALAHFQGYEVPVEPIDQDIQGRIQPIEF